MAQLPYSICVQRLDPAQLDAMQMWCFSQWPYTHQATWYSIEGSRQTVHRQIMYTRTWHFQREEDAQLFALTWT